MRLAVCSSKGGVGKTSTAANLAVVLPGRGPTLAGRRGAGVLLREGGVGLAVRLGPLLVSFGVR